MVEAIDEVEVERVIAVAIYRHAKSDIDALARNIIADLREAGYEIRRVDAKHARS